MAWVGHAHYYVRVLFCLKPCIHIVLTFAFENKFHLPACGLPFKLSLLFYSSCSLPFDSDLGQYDEAVKLSAQYPEIFPQRPV